ncbi:MULTISPECIES: hypothetical protein [unclassified Moorena]|uniref:hypothetical protein n=1 Tax=unclassified Moorena TaxID=2683338 RepID=UPI0013C70512|nr:MULTISPECIES: hypothetical protein [unclassified Moorena]NEP36455.1 hypothetical protein [Moorena sp. SIO3B2]NES44787.1 hypothetical protein [Moorena sp. SIO2C4]
MSPTIFISVANCGVNAFTIDAQTLCHSNSEQCLKNSGLCNHGWAFQKQLPLALRKNASIFDLLDKRGDAYNDSGIDDPVQGKISRLNYFNKKV